MLITKTHPGFGIRKRTIAADVRVGQTSFRFLAIAILAVIALFYLIQSSQGATGSLRLYELQQEQQKLTEEMRRLELEAMRLKSLNEIQKNTAGMEEVNKVQFLPESSAPAAN